MALAVQAQWDIANSAFALNDKLLGLVKAATVDDVQPQAVYAAEALGWHMIIDDRLIGKAVDALGGDQSYRLSNIRLHFGLSKGGVPSQIRQSTPAIKTFLLVTVLSLHMEAWEIGNVLYELLVQSKAIDKAPVSATQLTNMVSSIQGHARLLEQRERIALNFQVPIVEKLVISEQSSNLELYYSQLSPNQVASAMLASFETISDNEIHHLEICAGQAVIHLISLLCWLCPDTVEVVDANRQVLFLCASAQPKIRIVVTPHEENWTYERYFKINQPQSLVQTVGEDQSYWRRHHPSFIPIETLYSRLRCHFIMWSKEDLSIIGALSYGLMLAALYHGSLKRKRWFNDLAVQTIPFQDICSAEGQVRIRNSMQILGFPLDQEELGLGDVIAAYFPRDKNELLPSERHTLMRSLDMECMDGRACTVSREDHVNVQFIDLAMTVAEMVVVRATQRELAQVPFRSVFIENASIGGHFPILCPLLVSDQNESLSATTFVRDALLSSSTRAGELSASLSEILAVYCEGEIAYLSCLLDTPNTPAQAFEIIVQPGKIKWRDVSQDCLLGMGLKSTLSVSSQPSFYEFLENGKPLLTLPSLRNTNFRADGFTVTRVPEGIRLHYIQPSTGDSTTMFATALVNWALAERVQPSLKTLEQQINECVDAGISRLGIKSPGPTNIGIDPEYEHRMGVATYGGDKWADLLRFGTPDANKAYCLIQGLASIPDCALVARKLYNSGFIIMANP